ncbi:MAG TPA: fatty acid CoA ligase family protein [Candidatus Rifleibacterium sp.]|nr:fatty acid CoA ligase family protein [Candidatus Rifleibacterium sp.]HPT45862.1 fatty acid CoA ligase family protein [Candidatus Rifleibacterium sp.]
MPNNAGVNLTDFIRQKAEITPHKRAVVVPAGRDRQGRVSYTGLTFRQLEEETNRFARGFNRVGIRRGTRTVVMIKPGIEFFIAFFALCKVGATLIMIDPGIGLKSLKTCIGEAQPEAFVGVSAAHAMRVLMRWSPRTIKTCVTLGRRLFWGGHRFEDLRDHDSSPFATEMLPPDEMAALMFTSGSTGISKGVVYTHGILTNQVRFLQEIYGFTPADVDLATFPLFALFDVCLGMTAVIPDMEASKPAKADPRKLIEAINDNGATSMFGSPALIDTLSRYGSEHGIKLPSLRLVISCGAPARNDILQRLHSMLNDTSEIFTPYGATEALPVSSIGSRTILGETAAETDAGGGTCVGKPVPQVQIRIIRITDEPVAKWSEDLVLPPGQIGEIAVKGPVVTKEYFCRPQNTQLAKISEGNEIWHRMGDVGRLDAQGRLWFCGRKSHRVTAVDQVFFTIPCERIFNQHQQVFRTALVGIGAPGQQVPIICVELEKTSRAIDSAKLFNELQALGSRYEHTRAIKNFLVHPAFPVDVRHNAKINRETLAEWATEQMKGKI